MAYDEGSAGLAYYQVGDVRPVGVRGRISHMCGRIRFQLGGAILAATLAPMLLRLAIFGEIATDLEMRNSVLGGLWSVLLGFLILRKVTAFPGVRSTGYALAVLLGTFSITFVAFLVLRIQYSIFQLFMGFVLSTGYLVATFYVATTRRRMTLQVAPFGSYRSLLKLPGAEWHVLRETGEIRRGVPLVVDLREELPDGWSRAVTEMAVSGSPVFDARVVYESIAGRVRVEHLSENTFGSLMPSSIYATAKRQVDFLCALLGVLLLMPFMLLIAAWIRIDSAGPALYRQKRMGFRGLPFTVWKFRTMRVDADRMGPEAAMTRDNDPRVTRAGRFLRRTRLDELPQLWNILRGEMSWIGPRPEAMSLADLYEGRIPFYAYRHAVRPGLTGWAQVSQGHVTSVEDVELKLQYDFYYVKYFSLWIDLLVFAKTVRIVISGSGAK